MPNLKPVLVGVLALAAGVLGLVGWQLTGLVRPPRQVPNVHPNEFMVSSEDVEFNSVDGVPLRGWLLSGRSGAPALLLCHGLGTSRASLVNLAVSLHQAGYHVLLFDFRGHGESGGRRTTLGIDEAQDILGAIDFLATQERIDSSRVGGWGRDIGAYALVVAARHSDKLRSIALDGMFPDPGFFIGERLFQQTGLLQGPLAWLAEQEFLRVLGPTRSEPPASVILETLSDRNLFMVVASGRPRQAKIMRDLLEHIPEDVEGEKNLLELEAAWSSNLYGGERTRYLDSIRKFFLRTLPPQPSPSRNDKPIQLLEG